ncbi:LysR family transcriptional regulator [Vibrio chagasii]|uniref:LysR family transcriptional regulator n=1 Tax=Vibrio chagasii TaxID=170679 RepID=UPI0038CD396A
MFNFEQLRMFVEAAEQGSFSAAAKKLGKVQSAISQGIANLEIDFGLKLFDRSSRKPTLTVDGERLYKYAKVIVLQTNELSIATQSVYAGEESVIRLAIDDACLTDSFSDLMNRFCEQFPATELELISTLSTSVPELVSKGGADIGIMVSNLAFHQDLTASFIGSLPIVAVSHPQHPLSRLTQVNEMDLIVHRQFMLRDCDGRVFDQFPVQPAKKIWVNNVNTIRSLLIKSSQGWAFMPKHLVIDDIALGRLAKIYLEFDHIEWSPPIDMVIKKGKLEGKALEWLSKDLRHYITSNS